MDKTMELLREGKVAEAIKEFDTTRKFKVMTAGEAMMEVQFRMAVEQVDILRQLIREIRSEIASMPCNCEAYAGDDVLCRRCTLLDMIDRGLAKIGKERDDGQPA